MYIIVAVESGENRDCWKYSGTPLVTMSKVDSHLILAAMGYNEESECLAGASHNTHIKLDGYQEWIASYMYTRRP